MQLGWARAFLNEALNVLVTQFDSVFLESITDTAVKLIIEIAKVNRLKYMFKTIQLHSGTTPSLFTPLSSTHNQETQRQISSSKEVILI